MSDLELAADARTRARNAILTQIDLACLSDEVLALPHQHYVAISDTCNIHCPRCPRQAYFGDRWENGFLSFEKFEEHVAPLARSAQLLGLYGLGEPFLHRRFFDIVRLTKEAGAEALTNTHGMGLKPRVNDRIIESGLDVLNVSMDGATPEVFNPLREGADLEVVKRQVKDLAARRSAAGSATPRLLIACMINRDNLHELSDVVRMADELSVEQVDFSDTVICDPADIDISVAGEIVMWKAIDRAQEVGRELGIRVNYTLQRPYPWRPIPPEEQVPAPTVCELAWHTWLIGKHGEVNPCCFIAWEFGNVFTDDSDRIRNGAEARALRRRLMSGDLPRECRGCGCAAPLTERHQRGALDAAERLVGKTDLSDEERTHLQRIIAERRAMICPRSA